MNPFLWFRCLSGIGLISLFCCLEAFGQRNNIGIPSVRNFEKSDYGGGTQTWDFTQDKRGVIYAANNEGLLEFDGVHWRRYALPNKTIVRSLAIGSDGKIFVGGQGEVGFFAVDSSCQLRFNSLLELLPPEQQKITDVWDILSYNNRIFFRTSELLFAYNGETMEVLIKDIPIEFIGLLGDRLLVQSSDFSLNYWDNNQLSPLVSSPALNSPITGITSWQGDTVLLFSYKEGIYYHVNGKEKSVNSWKTNHDKLLKEVRINRVELLQGSSLVIGTNRGGLLHIDKNRRLIQHVNKELGLQSNDVLSLFVDSVDNLWLGLSTGIDYVGISSPLRLVIPDGSLEGTGYAIQIVGDRIYFGTSYGLFYTSWQTVYDPIDGRKFYMVAGSVGQVWGLSYLNDKFFLGHHEGPFLVKDGRAERIPGNENGSWTFVPVEENLVMGGHYKGLTFYKDVGESVAAVQVSDSFSESSRLMHRDQNGMIWMAHPYRGIYRIDPSQKPVTIEKFGAGEGLPSDLYNGISLIAGEVLVLAEYGVFRFEESENRFYQDTSFLDYFKPNQAIRYIREDDQGNLWFVAAGEVGVLRVSDVGLEKRVTKELFPELVEQVVGGFEFILPVDENNVFFGAEKGFFHLDPDLWKGRYDKPPELIFHKVALISPEERLVFAGQWPDNIEAEKKSLKFAAKENGFLFSFAATEFENPELVEYRTRLIGLEDNWTNWNEEPSRVVTNLPYGSYEFQAMARNPLGQESEVKTFSFSINPPWYWTRWAISGYFLMFSAGLLALIKWQNHKIESEKQVLQSAHEQKEAASKVVISQREAELTRVKNEKLEAAVLYKNQELASSTMHLVQKGEIILKIQDDLNKMAQKATPEIKTQIQKLLRKVEESSRLDEDWERFSVHFDQVHADFLKRLREKHPKLTQNDQRLCAFLRMNLSTKEIASLLNLSVRGVESNRYRLRKKLDLPGEYNLIDFLMEV